MKKLLSLVLALTLVMSLVVVPARAAVTGVTIEEGETLSLERGDEQTLTATVTKDGEEATTVTWSSNKKSVATVDSTTGKVKAVGKGEATITATSTADTSKKATCVVTVTDKLLVSDVTSVTFCKRTYTVTSGDASVYVFGAEDVTDDGKWDATLINGYEVDSVDYTASSATAGTLTISPKGEDLEDVDIDITLNDCTNEDAVTIEFEKEYDTAFVGSILNLEVKKSSFEGDWDNTTFSWEYAEEGEDGKSFTPDAAKDGEWTMPSDMKKDKTYTITCTAKVKSSGATPITVAEESFDIEVTDASDYKFKNLETKYSLLKGDTLDLTDEFKFYNGSAKVTSGVTYKYNSGTTTVATVSNSGKVTAVAEGESTITITATLTQDSGAKKEFTTTTKVEVVALTATIDGEVANGDDETFKNEDVIDAVVSAINKVYGKNSVDADGIESVEISKLSTAKGTLKGEDSKTLKVGSDITEEDITFEADAGFIGKTGFEVEVETEDKIQSKDEFVVTLYVKVTEDGELADVESGATAGADYTYKNTEYKTIWFYTGSATFKSEMYENDWTAASVSNWTKVGEGKTYTVKSSAFSNGSATLYAVALDADKVASTGTVTINQESIEYEGVAGEAVYFDQGDFEDYMEDAANIAKSSKAYVEFDYVTFTLPNKTTGGVLYEDGEAIKSSTKVEDVDKVSFVPSTEKTAKSVTTINFTLHAKYYASSTATKSDDKTYSGTVTVTVVDNVKKYSVKQGAKTVLAASDFNDVFTKEYKKGDLQYVQFTNLTNALAKGVSVQTLLGTAVSVADKCYYGTTTGISLSGLVVNAAATATVGTVSIPFTAYGYETSSSKTLKSVKGVIEVTVLQGRVMNFTDVTTANWYYTNVSKAYTMGLIDGKTATTFEPEANMTYAEAVKLAACMRQLYYDKAVTLTNSTTGYWYDSYVNYAVKYGIISAAPSATKANSAITRSEYVKIFYNALPASTYTEINSISKIPDVATNATNAKEIYDFYKAGILTGYANTPGKVNYSFGPKDTIKRCEVATILIRMMDSTTRVSFTL